MFGGSSLSRDRGACARSGQKLILEALEDRLLLSASVELPPPEYRVSNDWGTGFEASMTLRNDQQTTVDDWRLEFDYGSTIDSIWNAQIESHVGEHYVVLPAEWNEDLAPGADLSFGFIGRGDSSRQPMNYLLTWGSAPGAVPVTGTPPPPTPVTTTDVAIDYSVASDWQSGFTANITLANRGAALSAWTLEFDFSAAITSIWNASVTRHDGPHYVIDAADWNGFLASGATVSFGFVGTPGSGQAVPSNYILNGVVLGNNGGVPVVDPGSDDPGETTPPPPANETPDPGAGDPTPTPTPTPTPEPGSGDRRVVGYFTEWGIYGASYNVADIPAQNLTHLNYAFAAISPSGEVVPFDTWAALDKPFPGDTWDQPIRGNYHQLELLKERFPHLQTLISVGGWTLSSRFSDVALTEESRSHFASSAVDFIVQYGFDGIDLDWEYPVGGGLESNVYRPADRENYTLLVAEVRRQLDARSALDGQSYLLTIASPAGFDKIVNFDLAGLSRHVNWFNVMTYDYHGAWESTTNHQAPLYGSPTDPSSLVARYNIAWTIQAYADAGVAWDQLVLGVPLYARAWQGVPGINNGLYQPATGAAPGTWEPGMYDYRDLHDRLLSQPDVYFRYWDAAAQVPFIYSPSLGIFSTYEDSQSVQVKLDYVLEHELGGMFFWELSGDVRDPLNLDSLVTQVARALLGY